MMQDDPFVKAEELTPILSRSGTQPYARTKNHVYFSVSLQRQRQRFVKLEAIRSKAFTIGFMMPCAGPRLMTAQAALPVWRAGEAEVGTQRLRQIKPVIAFAAIHCFARGQPHGYHTRRGCFD